MREEKTYSVYKHTFPNGKAYIGITSQKPEKRYSNGAGYKKCPKMHAAILHYYSLRKAAEETGISASLLCGLIKKQKEYNGYVWRYAT